MSPPLEGASAGDLLERARALAPAVAAAADEIERNRRLPAPLVAALKEAGFFRMLVPRIYGGGEIDPLTFVQAIETLAQHDASTAWILCQTSVAATISARLPPETAHAIWDDPNAVLTWGPSTDARAVPVDGGYRVTGTFAFASGCWYASWLGGDCALCAPDGAPRQGADGRPMGRRVLFPARSATMRDIWNVIGLKGTGSDGYVVHDLFVPEAFTVARIDDPADRRVAAPLYALTPYNLFASGFAALAVGVARTLLDAFVDLAKGKTPRGFRHSLRDDGPTQFELGWAEARLRAARIYLMSTLGQAWDEAQRTNELSLDTRMGVRLAATYAIRQAKEVGDAAFDAAGTSSIFASSPFERRYRDLRTVQQQLQGRKSHFRTVGQHLLGLEAELGWI
jgi:alkylation response protein AidB-like acyl-CoA dehydrogenase